MSLSEPKSAASPSLALTASDRAETAGVESEILDLFDLCGQPLCRYVMSFGLARDVAEDIVQEAFLSLFRHLRLGRPRTNLKGWLFRVAHNLARRHLRDAKRRLLLSGLWHDTWGLRIDPAANPEEQVSDGQRRDRWHRVIRALPDRDRRCLALRAEGLRYREIAGVLGVSLGSVAKSLSRALARLVNADASEGL